MSSAHSKLSQGPRPRQVQSAGCRICPTSKNVPVLRRKSHDVRTCNLVGFVEIHSMPLVAYGSSESEDDSDAPRTKRSALMRKRSSTHVPPPNGPLSALPPVPPAFHDLYASAARVSTRDDPALHEGKQRAVPHIEGRWPAHIYLECKPCAMHASYGRCRQSLPV